MGGCGSQIVRSRPPQRPTPPERRNRSAEGSLPSRCHDAFLAGPARPQGKYSPDTSLRKRAVGQVGLGPDDLVIQGVILGYGWRESCSLPA
jgi:hypothetical protein